MFRAWAARPPIALWSHRRDSNPEARTRVHPVNLRISVPSGHEHDLSSVRRPSGITVIRQGVLAQVCLPAPIGIHQVR